MRLDSILSLLFPALFRIETKIDRLLASQSQLGNEMAQIDDDITALTGSVAAEQTVTASAVALLNGITTWIDAAVATALAAGATTAQLQAIADASAALKTQGAALSAAVSANTPAAGAATTPLLTPAVAPVATATASPASAVAPPPNRIP